MGFIAPLPVRLHPDSSERQHPPGYGPRREGWASAADAVRVITGVCSARKGTEGDRGIEE
ncbi:hypothetical protein GCM10010499_22990 [Streptomyces thermoviolaceus subsp. apingens]|nr:hypothetical protein GCM10010499_22990 [Streptomyces thermoviolaceus subsp. apingens]